MDWYYYNFIIIIELCKIPYKNLEIQLPYSSIFFAEISHTISSYQSLQKGCEDFF